MNHQEFCPWSALGLGLSRPHQCSLQDSWRTRLHPAAHGDSLALLVVCQNRKNTCFIAQWRRGLMVWNHLSIKSKTLGSNSRYYDFHCWSDLWVSISTQSVKLSPLLITKASECNVYQSLILPNSQPPLMDHLILWANRICYVSPASVMDTMPMPTHANKSTQSIHT